MVSGWNIPKDAKSVIDSQIRGTVNKPTGELSQADIAKVTGVWLGKEKVQDISFLSGFTQLKKLTLTDNQIHVLTPLAGLTSLEELDLGNNPFQDLASLMGLKNLKKLRIYNCLYLKKEKIDEFRAALPNCEVLVEFDKK